MNRLFLLSVVCVSLVSGAVSATDEDPKDETMAACGTTFSGTTTAVSGTTVAARPELAGVVLNDNLIPFEIRNATGQIIFAGKVQNRVVKSSKTGTLSFEFFIRNTTPGLPGRVTEVRRDGFGGWKTNIHYRLDGMGTIGPDSVNYTPNGTTVGFSFGKKPITAGATSYSCFVFTDATKFDAKAGSMVITADDGSEVTLQVAAPSKNSTVNSGTTVAVFGTTVAARPELAGVVLKDELIPFEIRNATGQIIFAGKVQNRVARSSRTGTLSFYFFIRETTPGLPGRITEVRRDGFGGWKIDANYRTDGLGTIGPDSVNYTPNGATVGFSFGKKPITAGAESRFCFIFTDATKFDAKAGSMVITADDGSTVTIKVATPIK